MKVWRQEFVHVTDFVIGTRFIAIWRSNTPSEVVCFEEHSHGRVAVCCTLPRRMSTVRFRAESPTVCYVLPFTVRVRPPPKDK